MPSDYRDDFNERQDEKKNESRLSATMKQIVNSNSPKKSKVSMKSKKSVSKKPVKVIKSGIEDGSVSSASMSISAEKKKSLKKERYSKGIEAACTVIVEIAVRDKKITDDQIDTILASLLCGGVVLSKSPKGKKALKKATHTDRDFVRMALNTCKKTKQLGGERGEMQGATASVLACRGLRKYNKCKFNQKTIDIMSNNIARETLAMREEEEEEESDESDEYESEDEVSMSSEESGLISETLAEKYYRGKKSHRRTKKIEKLIKKKKEEKKNTNKKEKSVGTKIEKKYVSNVAQTIDYCVFEEPSIASCEETVKSISSLDPKLRQSSYKAWNENLMDYISFGIAEAVNMCGSNLKDKEFDIKNDLRKNRLLRY